MKKKKSHAATERPRTDWARVDADIEAPSGRAGLREALAQQAVGTVRQRAIAMQE